MMYIHYCKQCNRIHMLNGHKINCPRCDSTLSELRISYLDYIHLDDKARKTLIVKCSDPHQLAHLTTTYRMFKYSKWYRESHMQPTTCVLSD